MNTNGCVIENEDRSNLLIMSAFPSYKLEDLLEMEPKIYNKLFDLSRMKFEMSGIDAKHILHPNES